MTLFFNIDNLDKESAGDPKRFMQHLYYFFYKKIPAKRSKYRIPRLPLVGSSFILNIEPLFSEFGLLKNLAAHYLPSFQ